jgi:hypothetical protein
MADEPVVIEATAGPYAGQRLTVPAADAKQAIADGWARDPFAPAEEPKEPKEVKEVTDEDRARVAEAAEKAARKLRGEEEPDNGKKTKETKSLEADKPAASYETKSTLPKSK